MSSSLSGSADTPQRGGQHAGQADVERQLDRILEHPLFRTSHRLSRFLRFAVENTLAGRVDELKEYVIGVDVFGLGASYNPQENPVVRIMAGRLRSKLAEYYLSSGLSDPVFIEIPKGGYVPRFVSRLQAALADTTPPVQGHPSRSVCVGREQELNRLGAAFASLSAGGQMWTVSGDAGMGKTTLCEAFLSGIEMQSPAVQIGRGTCSERLAETDAYVPILESLHTLLRSRSGRAAAEAMKTTAPAWYWQLGPVIGESGTRPEDGRPVSHERMRREIAELFEALSGTGPFVLFLDDMHWADASTCDLLAWLGARLHGLRVFILMTCRPTAATSRDNAFLRMKLDIERRGICQELPLPLLGFDDVCGYIAKQFPRNAFPDEFPRAVYERTEGNPLFMAGMLRLLRDRLVLVEREGVWVLEQSVREASMLIPAGISSLIRLKLDRLDDEDMQLLTCASVQGMQFDSAVLARVLSRAPAEVEERLQELETAHNFVRLISDNEFPNYTFSRRYQFVHSYYQNALYASLTPSRRVERSYSVAEALVSITGGTSHTVAADVALLFETAGDRTSAARYFHYAARNAARLFAYPEAILLCERGLRALAEAPQSRERDAQELALLLILGVALMVTRGYAAPEVEKVHRRSLELCRELNETRRLMPVLWALHTCEVNTGNLEPSLELAQQMREFAESGQDTTAAIQSLHALGSTLGFMGRLREARDTLERIFILQPVSQQPFRGSLYLLDSSVTSLSMLARLLAFMGYLDQAIEKAASSVELANRLAHPQSIAYATFWTGWVHHVRGEYDQSCRYLEPAMTLSREHGLALILEWGRVVRGSALARLGQLDEGIAEIRKSLRNQQNMRSLLDRAYCLTLLAEALAMQGANEEALALCDEALAFGRRTGGRCYEADTHRVRAELVPDSEAEYGHALDRARESECRLLELRAAVSYFRFQQKIGNAARGKEVLSRIADWYTEGDSSPVLSEARKLLEGSSGLPAGAANVSACAKQRLAGGDV